MGARVPQANRIASKTIKWVGFALWFGPYYGSKIFFCQIPVPWVKWNVLIPHTCRENLLCVLTASDSKQKSHCALLGPFVARPWVMARDCKTQTWKPKPGFRYQTRNPGLKSKPKNGFQVPKKWRKTSLSALHFYRKLYYMKKLLSFCGQMQTRPLNQHTFAVFMYCAVTFDYLLRWKSENFVGF